MSMCSQVKREGTSDTVTDTIYQDYEVRIKEHCMV